jgi:hypothetical protein
VRDLADLQDYATGDVEAHVAGVAAREEDPAIRHAALERASPLHIGQRVT